VCFASTIEEAMALVLADDGADVRTAS
jgi:hypothetical protein